MADNPFAGDDAMPAPKIRFVTARAFQRSQKPNRHDSASIRFAANDDPAGFNLAWFQALDRAGADAAFAIPCRRAPATAG